jgi:integrase/recombinase XerC
MDRARKGSGRLTPSGLYGVVRGTAASVGVKARPHGLRHAAITAALDAVNGDVRKTAKFSRHRDWRMLGPYYDEWKDDAGEVAGRVAAALTE